MSLLEEARKSDFKQLDNGDLSVENAVIIWLNFEGRPTKFNPAGGKRSFTLVLDEFMAEELRKKGWNVKEREPLDEGGDMLYFTEIILNLDSKFPPVVRLYTHFGGRKAMINMSAKNVGNLDRIDIENVDVIIHPFEHGFSSVASVKGYANVLHVTQAEDTNFGGKYNEYMNSDEMSDEDLPF